MTGARSSFYDRSFTIHHMGRLYDSIREAVAEDRFLVSWHGDERCEERGVSPWQLIADLNSAELVDERPTSLPNPSVRLRHTLADGSTVVAIWAWLSVSRRAKLVTVFFED